MSVCNGTILSLVHRSGEPDSQVVVAGRVLWGSARKAYEAAGIVGWRAVHRFEEKWTMDKKSQAADLYEFDMSI